MQARSRPIQALIFGALVVLGSSFAPAAAMTATSITVGGRFADWGVVLADPDNVVVDRSKAAGDPDSPNSVDRDLLRFAVDFDFGMMRMFQAYRDDPATEVRVLRDLDEAEAWAREGGG